MQNVQGMLPPPSAWPLPIIPTPTPTPRRSPARRLSHLRPAEPGAPQHAPPVAHQLLNQVELVKVQKADQLVLRLAVAACGDDDDDNDVAAFLTYIRHYDISYVLTQYVLTYEV